MLLLCNNFLLIDCIFYNFQVVEEELKEVDLDIIFVQIVFIFIFLEIIELLLFDRGVVVSLNSDNFVIDFVVEDRELKSVNIDNDRIEEESN